MLSLMHLLPASLIALLGLGLASGASAGGITYNFGGPIFGGDAQGATAYGSVIFAWDENCTGTVGSFCQLDVTLTYADTSGPTQNQGSVLAGVIFEPVGVGVDFRDGPPGNDNFGGAVGAVAMGGDDAAGETFATIDLFGTTYSDISGHWGLNPAIPAVLNLVGSTLSDNYGTHLLSSVGSFLEGEVNPNVGLASAQIFGGTQYLNLEGLPPNGSSFGIISGNLATGQFDSGFGSDTRVFAVGSIRASINYLGTLTNISDADPVFGTKGLPIPEPGTAALLGFGLLGLLGAGRRLRR